MRLDLPTIPAKWPSMLWRMPSLAHTYTPNWEWQHTVTLAILPVPTHTALDFSYPATCTICLELYIACIAYWMERATFDAQSLSSHILDKATAPFSN